MTPLAPGTPATGTTGVTANARIARLEATTPTAAAATSHHAGTPGAGSAANLARSRPTETAAVVLIRPEQVKLCPVGPACPLAGRILEREYHGHDSVVRVKPDGEDDPSVILARISGQVPYPVGSSVAVTVEGPVLAWRGTCSFGRPW